MSMLFEDQFCYANMPYPQSSSSSPTNPLYLQPQQQQQQQFQQPLQQPSQRHYLNIPNSNHHSFDGTTTTLNFNDFTSGYHQISAPASWSSANVSPSQSPPRSNASSPYPYCDVRRGRPLINDNEEESEKIKQKRNYARSYREKVRAEKSKIMDENKQLKSIIQRTLYLYTLPPQSIEAEIQKIQSEFNALNNSGNTSPTPPPTTNNPFAYSYQQQQQQQQFNYCRYDSTNTNNNNNNANTTLM